MTITIQIQLTSPELGNEPKTDSVAPELKRWIRILKTDSLARNGVMNHELTQLLRDWSTATYNLLYILQTYVSDM